MFGFLTILQKLTKNPCVFYKNSLYLRRKNTKTFNYEHRNLVLES